jgi:threonine aldolase
MHLLTRGRVLPEGYIASVAREVHARGVNLHLDGARLWHAAASLGQSVAQVAAGADSVQVCLSKGRVAWRTLLNLLAAALLCCVL